MNLTIIVCHEHKKSSFIGMSSQFRIWKLIQYGFFTIKVSVFRLRNVNIVGFYYLFNCATCFGHTTIFKHTYFPRTYSIDNGIVVFIEYYLSL
jgi:hypothetical protein